MPKTYPHSQNLPNGNRIGYSLYARGDVLYVRFQHDGKRQEITTGQTSKSDALNFAGNILNNFFCPEVKQQNELTWDKILTDLETVDGLRADSIRGIRTALKSLRSIFPHKMPTELTADDCKRYVGLYLAGKTAKGETDPTFKRTRKASSANTYHRTLNSLWNCQFATLYGIKVNPWQDVEYRKVEQKTTRLPTESTVSKFFQWLGKEYKGWDLVRLFCQVKAYSGCRTNDLTLVRSEQLDGTTLHILASQTKHKRERFITLPATLAKELHSIKGTTYLWEQYTDDVKAYRPSPRNRKDFHPKTLYWAIKAIFQQFNDGRTDKLKPHDFRRRAITLTVKSAGIDATAYAIGIDAQTARRYYLDNERAFAERNILGNLATTLLPS